MPEVIADHTMTYVIIVLVVVFVLVILAIVIWRVYICIQDRKKTDSESRPQPTENAVPTEQNLMATD